MLYVRKTEIPFCLILLKDSEFCCKSKIVFCVVVCLFKLIIIIRTNLFVVA